jgi:DNA-binding MarR family transcriptional regulator
MTVRKYITPGSRIRFRLSPRERNLVVERAFLDPEIEVRLRGAATLGPGLAVELTLDDIDDLAGCVAAEANHCEDGRTRRVLDGLFGRLTKLRDRFTDEAPSERRPALAVDAGRGFTGRQGQYLAFIFYYTKIHRAPPAEADFAKFFKVSPPAVHDMILALERRGLIERTPGKARSVRLRVQRADLPELE